MAKLRFWGFVPALCLLALPLLADNKMELGSVGVAKIGNVFEVPLTLETTDDVQGLVAAFAWDGAAGNGVALEYGVILGDADTLVRRVEPDYMARMQSARLNPRYLPDIPIPEGILLTGDMEGCVEGSEVVVAATPIIYMRGVCGRLAPEAGRKAFPLRMWPIPPVR